MANQEDLSLGLVKECARPWHIHYDPRENKVVLATVLTVIANVRGAPSPTQVQSTQQDVHHNLMRALIRLMKANGWVHLV